MKSNVQLRYGEANYTLTIRFRKFHRHRLQQAIKLFIECAHANYVFRSSAPGLGDKLQGTSH